MITAPGLYAIDAAAHHADPLRPTTRSLSSTGARRLLATCPARYIYEADNPTPPTDALRIGSAAHEWLLEGETWPQRHYVLPDDFNGRTKDGKALLDAIEADGKRPVKAPEFEAIKAMVDALRAHPVAIGFASPRREVSGFWQDAEFGVWRRCRWDVLPERGGIIVDYKMTESAHPAAISKAIATYGYHQQAAWYCDAAEALGAVEGEAQFLMVFQEKTAPYLITPVVIDGEALAWGRKLNRAAVRLFARCLEAGEWPGYAADVITAGLPAWAAVETQRRDEAGALELSYWFQSPIEEAAE